jgi:predicted RNase H-like HicB family nuclease
MLKSFPVSIYRDNETGLYWATCPTLRGCNSQGSTIEELKSNMTEAIELALETEDACFVMDDSILIDTRA